MSSADRLDDALLRTLDSVLDLLVPPSADGRMPGAGELGLGTDIDAGLDARPALRAPLAAALARLEEIARERAALPFAELEASARRALLDEIAPEHPAFLGPLVLQTYLAYYRQPRVLEALGLEPRPPFPGGHPVPQTDFSLLGPVRRREPFYRAP